MGLSMYKKLGILSLLSLSLFFLSSCVQPKIVYEGILPCADCSGLKTELTLYANGTYFLKETYLATRYGDQPHTSFGKYRRIKSRGREIVQLNYDKTEGVYNFLVVDHDHLRVLDKQFNEIDTPMNMTLTKRSGR